MSTDSDKPNVLPINPSNPMEYMTVIGNRGGGPGSGWNTPTNGGYGLFGGSQSTPTFYVQNGPGGLQPGGGNTIWGNGEAEGTGEPVSEGVLAKIDGIGDAIYEFLPEPLKKVFDVLTTDLTDVMGIDENSAIGAILNIATSWALGGPAGAAKEAFDSPYVRDTLKGLIDGATGFDMDDWGVSGGQEGLANIMNGTPSAANVESVQARALTYQQNAGLQGNDTQDRTTYATDGSVNVPAGGQTVQTGGSDGLLSTDGKNKRRPTAAPPSARPDYGTHDFNSGMDSGLLWNEYNETGETMRPSILPADNSGQPSFDDYNTRYNDHSYGGQPTPNTPPPSQPGGLLDSQWGDGTATQEDKNAFWGAAVQQNPDAFNQEQKQGIWANLAFQQNPDAFSQQQKKDLWYNNAMQQQEQQGAQPQPRQWGDGTATEEEKAAFMGLLGQRAQSGGGSATGGLTTGGGSGGYLGVGGSHSLAAPTWNQATGKYEGGGPVRMDGGAVTAADRAGILAEAQQGRDAFEASGGAQLQRERIARYNAAQQGSLLGQAQQSGGLI